MHDRRAVLVMAYGTPRDLGDVESYYTHIRRGRPPPPELLDELRERYRAIGGRSPLLEKTEAQAQGLQERLGIAAYLGQKHASPFIADAVAKMAADGIEEAVGLVLAPHYSSMSIGQYRAYAESAAEDAGWSGDLRVVESWATEPGYVKWLAARVEEQLNLLTEAERTGALVVFSAHSLPQKIVAAGDPYPGELEATAEAVASTIEIPSWRTGWQSAGRTTDPWLGPDILDIVRAAAEDGVPAVVICPCGFVADHLEVLYDVDIEAKALADELDMTLRRTPSPNDDPAFLDTLAGVVRRSFDPAS